MTEAWSVVTTMVLTAGLAAPAAGSPQLLQRLLRHLQQLSLRRATVDQKVRHAYKW